MDYMADKVNAFNTSLLDAVTFTNKVAGFSY